MAFYKKVKDDIFDDNIPERVERKNVEELIESVQMMSVCAAITPTTSPFSTMRPDARLRP